MRTKFLIAAAMTMLASGLSVAEPSALPYDEFFKFTENHPGEKVDGNLLIAAFIKASAQGEKLDAVKSNFRIQLADGTSIPLHCEALPAKAEEGKTQVDQNWIARGFTHKLWIPKDAEKYKGAALLNDLPPNSLEIQFPLPARETPAP